MSSYIISLAFFNPCLFGCGGGGGGTLPAAQTRARKTVKAEKRYIVSSQSLQIRSIEQIYRNDMYRVVRGRRGLERTRRRMYGRDELNTAGNYFL